MYEVIKEIIDHVWDSSSYSNSEQQVVYYIAGALIIIFSVTFVDIIYRLFRHFWR